MVAHIFSTITMVPLLDTSSKFNLFELHNLAIPDTSLNLSVSYAIESKFIAISESNQHFALLSDQDYYKCSGNYNHYCSFASPLYLAHHHESCVMALYRKANNEIKQFCQVQFSKHITSKAVYLGKGLWTILVTKPENLKITCIDKPNKLLKINGPIKLIQLEKSCTGYADTFILPAYFEGHSQIENNMGPNIEPINTSFNASQFQIWQNLNLSNPTARKFHLHKLEGMKKYYIANVHSALQEYTPDLPENSEWGITDWTLYIILPVGGGFVTLIIAFLVFIKCRPCAKVAKQNHQNKSHHAKHEIIELKPYSRPMLTNIAKCDRISVHMDSL